MSESNRGSSRLERWQDEEVEVYRSTYALSAEAEQEYRDALASTFKGAFLALEDQADTLRQPFRWLSHRQLRKARKSFEKTRDRSLREWFARHW